MPESSAAGMKESEPLFAPPSQATQFDPCNAENGQSAGLTPALHFDSDILCPFSSSHEIEINVPSLLHIAGGARLDHNAGYGIGYIVVRAGRVPDQIASTPRGSALQIDELSEQPLVI
jgi:hypothetical protein